MRPVWRPVVPRKGLPGGSRDDRRQGDGRASLGLRRDSPLPYLSLRIGLSRGAGLSPFASARADNRLIPSTTGGAAVRSLSLRSGDHRTGHPGEPPRLSLWRRCPPSRHTTFCPGAARRTATRLSSSWALSRPARFPTLPTLTVTPRPSRDHAIEANGAFGWILTAGSHFKDRRPDFGSRGWRAACLPLGCCLTAYAATTPPHGPGAIIIRSEPLVTWRHPKRVRASSDHAPNQIGSSGP